MKPYRRPLTIALTVLAVLGLVLLLRPRRLSGVLPGSAQDITFCKVMILSTSPEIGTLDCSPEQLQALREQLPRTWVRWVAPWGDASRSYDEAAYHLIIAWGGVSCSAFLTDRGELIYGRGLYRTCFDDDLFDLVQSWRAVQA